MAMEAMESARAHGELTVACCFSGIFVVFLFFFSLFFCCFFLGKTYHDSDLTMMYSDHLCFQAWLHEMFHVVSDV